MKCRDNLINVKKSTVRVVFQENKQFDWQTLKKRIMATNFRLGDNRWLLLQYLLPLMIVSCAYRPINRVRDSSLIYETRMNGKEIKTMLMIESFERWQSGKNYLITKFGITGRVVTTIFKSLQTIDKYIDNLFAGMWRQIV